MKRLFTILLLIVLVVSSGYAKKASLELFKKIQQDELRMPVLKADNIPTMGKDQPLDKIQALGTIDRVIDGSFNHYAKTTPIVYEPVTNSIIIVNSNRVAGTTGPMTGSIYLFSSTNNGGNWVKREIYSRSEWIPCYPSISVLNPDQSTNTADLKFMAYSVLAKYQASDQTYPWTGALYVVVDKASIEPFDFFGPQNNSQQRWFWSVMSSSSAHTDMEVFYHAGMTTPRTGQAYGYYGIGAFEIKTNYDFLTSKIPDQWGLDRFMPSDDIESSFNGPMDIDVDNNGNVYAAVINILKSDQENRVPAISKSVDDGKTWSEFDPMPASIMDAYIALEVGQDYAPMPNQLPYHSNGFVVTGEDEYSLFFRVWITTDGTMYNKFQIVEAYKKAGAWGIRKVSDYEGLPIPFVIEDVSPGTTLLDSITTNRRGNEIQAAKTADGSAILVKWLDFRADPVVLNPPVAIYNGQITIDTVATTDVMMASRQTNETQWSKANNVTNDVFFDKITWIPHIIPSLKKVPLMANQTVKATNAQHPRFVYPDFLQQLCVDQTQDVGFKMVDATLYDGVNDPQKANFLLKDIYPNPSTNLVEIGFNIERSANVRLEVYTALGQKIATLVNGWLPEGVHAANFDTRNLIDGVYYYNLTVDGRTATKMMVVNH
jgi:hypothetical protein